MLKTSLSVLTLALAVSLAPGPSHGQTAGIMPPGALIALKSVSIDLPAGDRMFEPGPGVDAMNGNCIACHSAGMVLNQPAMSKAAWEAEVHKMINVYKAPVAAGDVPEIVAYLDNVKGTK